MSRFRSACLVSAIVATLASSAMAQVCTGSSNIGFINTGGTIDKSPNCVELFYCYPPELLGVRSMSRRSGGGLTRPPTPVRLTSGNLPATTRRYHR